MIHYIKGHYITQFESGVVIDVGGIGYEIHVPESAEVYRCAEGQNIMLYTYMAVREDDVRLYGFSDREGLKLFKQLITVSGIGAKGAMAILSSMSTEDCRRAIAFEDVATLTKAQGIGKKTAQRIVLELKDKVAAPFNSCSDLPPELVKTSGGSDNRSEAINALIALGYSRSEAVSAIASVNDSELSSEDYIKQALKQLF